MQPRSCQEGERSRESACLQYAFTPLAGARRRQRRTRNMVHGKNRIPYRIDRRLTGLAGPDYDATISFGLPLEPEDSQYGKSRIRSRLALPCHPAIQVRKVPAGEGLPLLPEPRLYELGAVLAHQSDDSAISSFVSLSLSTTKVSSTSTTSRSRLVSHSQRDTFTGWGCGRRSPGPIPSETA